MFSFLTQSPLEVACLIMLIPIAGIIVELFIYNKDK